jgi:hypothetical protein
MNRDQKKPICSSLIIPRSSFTIFRLVFPLPRQRIFFLVVTLLAGGDEISFRRFPASYEGDEMIHCQLRGRKPPLAVVADPHSALASPPLRTAEFTRLVLLALNIRSVEI